MMAAVGVGYSGWYLWDPPEIRGHGGTSFGGRDGVRSVQWFGAVEMWQKVEDGTVDAGAAGSFGCHPRRGALRLSGIWKEMGWACSSLNTLMVQGAVFMLPGYLAGVALLRGWEEILHSLCGNRGTSGTALPHFAYLLKAIETMVWTGGNIPSRGPCSHRGCWIGY